MSTELSKKKIRGGHRTSAKRIVQQSNDTIADHGGDPANDKRLQQIKLSLEEKLRTLNQLDEEILNLVDEDAVGDEIEQADLFKEKIYECTINIENYFSKRSPPPATPTPC